MDTVDPQLKPSCGGPGTQVSDDLKKFIAPLLVIVGLAATLAGYIMKVVKGLKAEEFANLISVIPLPILAAIVYVALQIAIITLFGLNWRAKCRKKAEGIRTCLSGVVNTVHEADIRPFPFLSRHPHVDLVLKHIYWPNLDWPQKKYVYCSDIGPPGTASPILKVFFKSSRICKILAAAFGGSFAAPLVALVAVNGILATTGAATLGAMLGFFLFALLFIFAAFVAGLIASAIAAAATNNDAPEADDSSAPNDGGSLSFSKSVDIASGDLLTVRGPIFIDDNFRGSVVVRFAEESIKIGSIAAIKQPEYTYIDADEAIDQRVDVCDFRGVDPDEDDIAADVEPPDTGLPPFPPEP